MSFEKKYYGTPSVTAMFHSSCEQLDKNYPEWLQITDANGGFNYQYASDAIEELNTDYDQKLIESSFGPLIQTIEQLVNPLQNATLLEIGGSSGLFAKNLQDKGAKITLLETQEIFVKKAKERGINDARIYNGTNLENTLRGLKFSAVIANRVFEDIVMSEDQASRMMRQIKNLIEPNGLIIVGTQRPEAVWNTAIIKGSGLNLFDYRQFTDNIYIRQVNVYKKISIAIIGGGLTGLVAGYRLGQKGYKITIFEKENFLGGLAGGFKINGQNLEKVYHHIFKTDKEFISLIKELGLESKLKWHESSIGLYYKNNIYPFLGAIDLLKFQPLSLIDKFRLGFVAIYLQKTKNWKKFEKITAYDWMKKYCGKKAFGIIWEPLLKGKFHNYYKKVSMVWMWARIHTRTGSSEKGKEMLGYIDGGFEILIKKLEEKILKNGGKIKLNCEIKNQGLNKLSPYDIIIDTTPGKNVDYLGAINVVFSSKQNLSKYYWHNINDLNSPFLAFIQHTNLVGKKNYKNQYIYYLGSYVPHNHKYFSVSDKEIYKEFFDYLKIIFPKFDQKRITSKFVFKFKNAQHVVTTNYKIPKQKIGKNIYKVNFSQIYPEDRGMNYAVREAEKISKIIKCFIN